MCWSARRCVHQTVLSGDDRCSWSHHQTRRTRASQPHPTEEGGGVEEESCLGWPKKNPHPKVGRIISLFLGGGGSQKNRRLRTHGAATHTEKHHQVKTKIFSPHSWCVPTYGLSHTGLCNKVCAKVRKVEFELLQT